MPTEREYFGVANVNDTLYVIGGQTHYYPNLESWSSGPHVTSHGTVERYIPFGYGTVSPSPTANPSAPSDAVNQPIPTEFIELIIAIAIVLLVVVLFAYTMRKSSH